MVYEELIIDNPTKVLIIDDVEEEIRSIRTALDKKKISYKYRNVDITGEGEKDYPIDSVELVFLDLDYGHGFLGRVDPYLCAEQVKKGVKEGQNYYLVGWTKDPDDVPEVVNELGLMNLLPVTFTAMQKSKYHTGDREYDISRLFRDINIEFKKAETIQEFIGQVIEKEENAVLINCIIHDDPGTFEVRRFDLLPFQNHIILTNGAFLRIKITTKPGSRIFEFFPEAENLSHLFIKTDDFEDFDDLSFLQSRSNDENNL